MDRTAEIWTRVTGEPRHLGKLVLAGNHVRFTYAEGSRDLPGLSLVHDMAKLAGETVVWPSTIDKPFPPMLQALVPPTDPNNLQRRILTRIMERSGTTVAQGQDLEWTLLLLGGRSSIGHLEVFEDKNRALAWYGREPNHLPFLDIQSSSLLALATASSRSDIDLSTLDKIIDALETCPTSSGVMPKLLMPIEVPESKQPVDAVVKFQGGAFPDIVRLESVAYRVFDRLEQDVPDRWLQSRGAAVLLATRRFDRQDGIPVPMESAFSALFTATGGKVHGPWPDSEAWHDIRMLANAIFTPSLGLSIDPKRDAERLYQRMVANILMGISDSHLMNLSFIGRRGHAALSPVYDPAPMRAYQSMACISRTPYGWRVTSYDDEPSGTDDLLIGLSQALRISAPVSRKIVQHLLAATEDYPELVRASNASDSTIGQLLQRVKKARYWVHNAIENSVSLASMDSKA